jgi:hypothetical protein
VKLIQKFRAELTWEECCYVDHSSQDTACDAEIPENKATHEAAVNSEHGFQNYVDCSSIQSYVRSSSNPVGIIAVKCEHFCISSQHHAKQEPLDRHGIPAAIAST